MQIRKWIAALAAGIVCTLPCVPIGTAAEEEGETYSDGMFTFAYTDGGVELCGCDTSALSVRLPAETDGYKIVGIADGAFYGCSDLESVELQDGIGYIGRYAFAGCESLKTLTVPDSVETIGANAFSGCVTLGSLHLPDKLTEIPEGMCYTCVSLTDVNIPDTVTAIGDEAFYSCTLLTGAQLPDSITELGNYAFAFCTNLMQLDVPKGVTKLNAGTFCGCESAESFTVPAQLEDIGSLSFLGCTSLTSFEVADDNLVYSAQDGVIYTYDRTTLCAYPAGSPQETFTIPEGVTTIYDAAFFRAEHLTGVMFPSTLQYIGAGAFEYCTSLRSVELPEGVEILYENAFSDCTALSRVTLPETLKGVGSYAFYACPNLKEVTIPANCKTIGDYAFGYTDGTQTDESGNAEPVRIEGFRQHGEGPGVGAVIGIIAAVIVLGGAVFFLVRVIRKNQMTPEEHEANILAGEEYEGIAEDTEDTETAETADDASEETESSEYNGGQP